MWNITVFLWLAEPATGNYSEEIPPPTYKPPRGHDDTKDKSFVHEFDTHKEDKQSVQSNGKFMSEDFLTYYFSANLNLEERKWATSRENLSSGFATS